MYRAPLEGANCVTFPYGCRLDQVIYVCARTLPAAAGKDIPQIGIRSLRAPVTDQGRAVQWTASADDTALHRRLLMCLICTCNNFLFALPMQIVSVALYHLIMELARPWLVLHRAFRSA